MPSNIQKQFALSLNYCGRILEVEGKHVWGTSGFVDEQGRVHVYFSNWSMDDARASWVISCKVNYAIAESLDSEFVDQGTVLEGAGGDCWDAWSIHNPCVHKVGDKYVMLYMGSNGNSFELTKRDLNQMILVCENEGTFNPPNERTSNMSEDEKHRVELAWDSYTKVVESKRIGMAIADKPSGPFVRIGDTPLIDTGLPGEWDDLVTSNPAFCVAPNGQFYLYYKAWNKKSWQEKHGNRKYGVAVSDTLEGPYIKSDANPIVDFEPMGEHCQLEDATVFYLNDQFHMVARDMGLQDHVRGIIMSSIDGITFNDPELAFHGVSQYSDETIVELKDMARSGNYERPQIIKDLDGAPVALICASTGGKYGTSSPVLFKIDESKLK
ncbi:glycosyl hydrolase family 43 [Vibrio astriarenae]|uniref:Glycosyl hydrolase family 43 n=1 Tax=Vibrio astriarenae TaxID=1481923 RepID=A0A7Z2T363_9VIBR|nr:glycoside hydrolase family protein [Vibrio astriarenae]QIA63523.1 glycosyl hydrolase family 43 [Vibrio astriarenae]